MARFVEDTFEGEQPKPLREIDSDPFRWVNTAPPPQSKPADAFSYVWAGLGRDSTGQPIVRFRCPCGHETTAPLHLIRQDGTLGGVVSCGPAGHAAAVEVTKEGGMRLTYPAPEPSLSPITLG